MKNLKILILTGFIIIPKTIFGIVGFGLNVIQDGTKMEGAENIETSAQGSATVKSYEMESLPAGAGGYIFIDLAGWAIELEANVVGGEYDFEFIKILMEAKGFHSQKLLLDGPGEPLQSQSKKMLLIFQFLYLQKLLYQLELVLAVINLHLGRVLVWSKN